MGGLSWETTKGEHVCLCHVGCILILALPYGHVHTRTHTHTHTYAHTGFRRKGGGAQPAVKAESLLGSVNNF